MRALVVDDSRAMRGLLVRLLRGLGFEVTEAPDGSAALDLVVHDASSFDLALVDWNMPIMGGLELVHAIRKEHRFDAMRIMMVTTENDIEHVVSALDAGANEYLMKPFTPEAVSEKLALLGLVEVPS